MSDYNFVESIKNEFKVDELNSNTLTYRINNFIKACNMNLSDGIISKENSSLINIKSDDYDLKFFKDSNEQEGNSFVLIGNYDDIEVSFTNFYDNDKKVNKINELPFRLSLVKNYNDIIYTMDINTTTYPTVKFTIGRNKELPQVISFQANILDFSIILKLVKSFTTNPEFVYDTYNNIINQKNIILTNGDLNKGIIKDDSLDEPVKGFKKIIRRLFK